MDNKEIRPSNRLKKSSNLETSTVPAKRLPSTEAEKAINDSCSQELRLDENYLSEEEAENSEIDSNRCRGAPDEPLMKEISSLKEKLESLMMCQICYE